MGGLDPSGKGTASSAPIAPWKWGVVWLMFLATMINYMDRQTMGATSPHYMYEFGLTEFGYGALESAFQISFAFSQILAGYLADRLNLRWLYAGALLIWSAAGFFTGLAGTIALMMACRMVLGFGEAFNWPCAISIVGRILPREAHSLANGIFHSGASVGAALTPIIVVVLLAPSPDIHRFTVIGSADSASVLIWQDTREIGTVDYIQQFVPTFLRDYVGAFDWRFVFQLIGAIGLLWAILWFWVVRGRRAAEMNRRPEPSAVNAKGELVSSFWSVFTLRKFWLALTISTTVNISWHFYRVWLPRILDKDLGYSSQEMLLVFAAFFVAADLGSMAAGWVTRRLTLGGMPVERSRQLVMFGVSSLCLLAIPVALLGREVTLPGGETISAAWIKVPLILVLAAGAMGGFANMFALGQDVSPPHTGKIVGLMGAVPWFILFVMSLVVGWLAERLGTFAPMLIAIGFVPLIGAVAGLWWPKGDGKAVSTH